MSKIAEQYNVSFVVSNDVQKAAKTNITEHQKQRFSADLGRMIGDDFDWTMDKIPGIYGDTHQLSVVVMTPAEYHRLKQIEWSKAG